MEIPPPMGSSSRLWAKALCAATAASAVHLCKKPWTHDAGLGAGEAAQEVQGFCVPSASHLKGKDNKPTALGRKEFWVSILAFFASRLSQGDSRLEVAVPSWTTIPAYGAHQGRVHRELCSMP